jgi:hypothetical protein
MPSVPLDVVVSSYTVSTPGGGIDKNNINLEF